MKAEGDLISSGGYGDVMIGQRLEDRAWKMEEDAMGHGQEQGTRS